MEPVVKHVVDAFTRIRAILFVNITICALIFANTYLENFSFDTRMTLISGVFDDSIKQKIKKLKNDRENIDNLFERSKMDVNIGELEVRRKRIENTVNKFTLRSINVPVVGISVPANDLVIIGGIFLLSISIWLVFSINQIKIAFDGMESSKILEKNYPVMRTSMMFVLPKGQTFLRMLAFMVVAAPALTMTVATINDLQSFLFSDQKTALFHMMSLVIIRLMSLSAITVALWLIAIMSIQAWMSLNDRLSTVEEK